MQATLQMRFSVSQVTRVCVKPTKSKQCSRCGLYRAHARSCPPVLPTCLPSAVESFLPSKFMNWSQTYSTTKDLNLERWFRTHELLSKYDGAEEGSTCLKGETRWQPEEEGGGYRKLSLTFWAPLSISWCFSENPERIAGILKNPPGFSQSGRCATSPFIHQRFKSFQFSTPRSVLQLEGLHGRDCPLCVKDTENA